MQALKSQAIGRKFPSRPIKWLHDNGFVKGSVLHHGRGKDIAGSKLISSIVGNCAEYDPSFPDICKIPDIKFDAVISSYVLNCLSPFVRTKAVQDIATATKKTGSAFIAVRGQSANSGFYRTAEKWKRYKDGFTNGILFQKFYTPNDLISDLQPFFKQIRIITGSNKSLFIIAEAKHMSILPDRSKKFGIGKDMGNNGIYVHQSYESIFPTIKQFKKYLAKEFNYQLVKFNPKTGGFTFIQSHDFNTMEEPTMGDAWLIKSDGSKKFIRAHSDPWIYHHKWLMVADDYKGFNVQKSKLRSELWLNIPGINKSKIGKKSYWEKNIIPIINNAPR